jgi:flagellar basal-body rod protein FlgB
MRPAKSTQRQNGREIPANPEDAPMDLDQIPLLAMIKGKLGYDTARQRTIAQNVANADTPGYAPSDLDAFTFKQAMAGPSALAPVAAARTDAAHISPPKAAPTIWKSHDAPDSEARLDGNQVVLEEQMMKMTEARMDYDAAVSLYQQSLGLLKLATRRPGG